MSCKNCGKKVKAPKGTELVQPKGNKNLKPRVLPGKRQKSPGPASK